MILQPRFRDFKTIGFYLGKIILGLALTMALPVVIGIIFKEINPVLDFLVSIGCSVLLGLLLVVSCRTDDDLNWMQGMIVVSVSWIVAMILGAVPLYLSGHWGSFLDA